MGLVVCYQQPRIAWPSKFMYEPEGPSYARPLSQLHGRAFQLSVVAAVMSLDSSLVQTQPSLVGR
jgi:hypothetical protein